MLNAVLMMAVVSSGPSSSPATIVREVPAPVIVPAAMAAQPRIVAVRSNDDGPTEVLDLRISWQGGLIWQDSLRVAPRANASVSQNRTEAEAVQCPGDNSQHHAARTSFSINVHAVRTPESDWRYSFRVNWTRPASSDGCAEEGTRSVELHQTVAVPHGRTVILEGDAGLKVEVSRR